MPTAVQDVRPRGVRGAPAKTRAAAPSFSDAGSGTGGAEWRAFSGACLPYLFVPQCTHVLDSHRRCTLPGVPWIGNGIKDSQIIRLFAFVPCLAARGRQPLTIDGFVRVAGPL